MAKPRYRSDGGSPETYVDKQGNPAPPEWYRRRAWKWNAKYLSWDLPQSYDRLFKYEDARAAGKSREEAITLVARSERFEFGTDDACPDMDERHRMAIERSLTRARSKLP